MRIPEPILPGAVLIVIGALALAACNRQPATPSSSTEGPRATASVTIPPVSGTPAGASSSALPGDHAQTKHYRIDITLPALPSAEAPLAHALRATADNAKREFLQALPDPKQFPEFADRQLELLLDFKVAANTPAFTSVRETGMQDTGGAHPIPVEASFVYDRKANRVIALDDLFANPDAARKALAGYARTELSKKLMAQAPRPGEGSSTAIREWKTGTIQMLGDGTRPTAVNFSVFMVRAGADKSAASPGLTLIFPPYQVAAYVYGTQTVDVPAAEFAKFLKPEYRAAFAR